MMNATDSRLECRFTYRSLNLSPRSWDLHTIILYTQNPALSKCYSGHIANTTVARISPSGYYCASADNCGTGRARKYIAEWPKYPNFAVRIWDVVGEDQILKNEYRVLSAMYGYFVIHLFANDTFHSGIARISNGMGRVSE